MGSLPSKYFLYADDDTDDQLALIDIVGKIDQGHRVITCGHGLALLQFLEALKPGDPLPCCIVLDINMPLWDGMRTLTALKSHEKFQHLKVVMFTTSSTQREAERSRELGAETFLTKPVSQKDFEETTKTFSLLCEDETTFS